MPQDPDDARARAEYDEQLAEALARLLVAEHRRRQALAAACEEKDPPADHAA